MTILRYLSFQLYSDVHYSYDQHWHDMCVLHSVNRWCHPNLQIPDYLVAWYQSVKGASPIRSGVYSLPFTFVLGISLILTGVSVNATKSYRVQLWAGWVFFIVAMGAFTTLKYDTPVSHALGLWSLVGVGGGLLYSAQYFPVLAPLPISENAHALALFGFFRTFASVSRLSVLILGQSHFLTDSCLTTISRSW